jgi:hypothetical protein
MKIQRGDGIIDIHSFSDIRCKKDDTVFSALGWPHITQKEIAWYSFMLNVAWTPGLLNTERKNKSLENFQGPYRESNQQRHRSLFEFII